ncbi:cyclin-dependent kinase inhibitor 3 family protein [Vibrio sp. YMD68]|uniref:cyclin-dependent kinase inhibitor 3 family protein n=1 Tax=Vibrio sp. YMD68 TaxID=3042300 RepID=UPI00249C4E61|nr:cyclin-dependent kinase inhibitor 3 family protein [Vibrio sp. YMD68]WGW01944.1 cyclin-dependent kinase inhibitor 3 family protein [Vibrio sp. YMD68]
MTHPTWELAVEEGALILTPCPGTKGTDLSASLEQLKAQGVKAIVTAINAEEMASKGVEALGEVTNQLGMEWHHIVIEDDCAPDETFAQQWASASPQLHKIISDGHKVALHCMGGSGRTGLFAAHLLLEREWPLERIVKDVQALRPGAFTKPIQIEYISGVATQ